MAIVQPIFPPPDYLKHQVYNNKHCDDRDRKIRVKPSRISVWRNSF